MLLHPRFKQTEAARFLIQSHTSVIRSLPPSSKNKSSCSSQLLWQRSRILECASGIFGSWQKEFKHVFVKVKLTYGDAVPRGSVGASLFMLLLLDQWGKDGTSFYFLFSCLPVLKIWKFVLHNVQLFFSRYQFFYSWNRCCNDTECWPGFALFGSDGAFTGSSSCLSWTVKHHQTIRRLCQTCIKLNMDAPFFHLRSPDWMSTIYKMYFWDTLSRSIPDRLGCRGNNQCFSAVEMCFEVFFLTLHTEPIII